MPKTREGLMEVDRMGQNGSYQLVDLGEGWILDMQSFSSNAEEGSVVDHNLD